MKIEYIKTEDLIPYIGNSRTHSDDQVLQVAASMREFGFTNPILIDANGTIIAGHGRLLAAKKIAMDQVPCIRLGNLTPTQVRAYVIADNKLAMKAGWDEELLKVEVERLLEEGFDVSLTGFESDELKELFSVKTPFGLTDENDVPETPENPVSVLGDVWLCGTHRIVCGDTSDSGIVQKLLGSVKPHLMVTDPPYGVNYDPSWRQKAGLNGKGTATGKVLNDDKADWRNTWALFPGSVAYVWHGALHSVEVAESLKASRFNIRSQIIWVKQRLVIGRSHYHWQHEPCFYSVREGEDDQWRFVSEHEILAYSVKDGETGKWNGDRKQSSVWFIEHVKSNTGHGTQKPVDCMRRPIINNSSPGQAVYEPFSGSGTTLLACEQTGRVCFAGELNPAYVDVAVTRWQDFTGKEATNEATGKTFNKTKLKMEGKK